MKNLSLRAAVVLLAALVVSGSENQNATVLKVGYLYRLDGKVLLEGEPIAPRPEELLHLGVGQRLETLAGRAEMLVHPGGFIRIAPYSLIELTKDDYSSTRLRVVKGAAVLDLTYLLKNASLIVDVGENDRIEVLRQGVYRIDVPPKGPARVRTVGGRAAVVFQGEEVLLRKGREIGLAAGGKPTRVSGEPDELDKWHYGRHQEWSSLIAEVRRKNKTKNLNLLETAFLNMYRHTAVGWRAGGPW